MVKVSDLLPPGVQVFERGWLSANNILFRGSDSTALVDSGYFSHRSQTVALVQQELDGRPLDLLLNTHLHSDHCGGNAALQAAFPGIETWIPPGEADAVSRWDEEALSYRPTGQNCERFSFSGLLQAGSTILLAGRNWEMHAAPGHDPHSIILFEPVSRTLLSADALWESGFGVIFPELLGEPGFDEVASTLDLIESLDPALIIPGHGAPFTGISAALSIARHRLSQFAADPLRHANHAAKVLLKFKLLEFQSIEYLSFERWAAAVPYLRTLHARHAVGKSMSIWIGDMVHSLQKSGAAQLEGTMLRNV
ncbi:MBL fold metallo-hydrolase [Variovorax sp. VNK109]|uniref:MBL fold metallo-hydrolase n=1 Tax=Variovorax sp. VNK109 TaxID=3400919 RepID=UPI003C08901B